MIPGSNYPRNTALAFLLAGNPGSGKTVTCFGFPDPWILDCEGNLKSGIERNPGKRFWYDSPERKADGTILQPYECWARCEELIKAAGSSPDNKVLVVDGLGQITRYLKDFLPHIMALSGEKIPVIAGQKQMTLQLWGEYARRLEMFVKLLRSYGKPVVVTCHVKVDENEMTSVKELKVDIQGALASSLAKVFTDFYLLKAEPSTDAKYKESGGVRFYMRTAATSRIELKSHNNKVIPAEMELGDAAWVKLMGSLVAPASAAEVKP